ncbi:MAG: glycosyltransferase family 9 protein [Bacteroidia bacterium]
MKFLVLQTAFIGDAILATAVAEKLHAKYPEAQIDILVRKGNESLFESHPYIKNIFAWDKKNGKIRNLFHVAGLVRKQQYDHLINLHRFASSGIITALSGAKSKRGFDKNPLSFLFTKKYTHEIGGGMHEVERNQQLIADLTDGKAAQPKLFPAAEHYKTVEQYKQVEYICIAPTSVWFTKQLPKEKWVELCDKLRGESAIYLLGAPGDHAACEWIVNKSKNSKVVNLCGKLNFLQSAALMKDAKMNYVNDSAPMHIASAMDAATTAVYCSTIPAFGFGPLSSRSRIVETRLPLKCRPCGLHGHKACPLGHFECAVSIEISDLLNP